MKKVTVCMALLLAAVFIVQAAVPAALHAEKYEKLFGLFGDIEGWKGKDPEGMAMDMPGMKMIQAMRTYVKDDNEITAMIMLGDSPTAHAFMPQGGMHFESSESKAVAEEIDGFMVYTMYDKDEGIGAVTVLLLPREKGTAFFVVSFDEHTGEEALEIAKKFDWKEMKKKVESLD
jgi:hypothetical protein